MGKVQAQSHTGPIKNEQNIKNHITTTMHSDSET